MQNFFAWQPQRGHARVSTNWVEPVLSVATVGVGRDVDGRCGFSRRTSIRGTKVFS